MEIEQKCTIDVGYIMRKVSCETICNNVGNISYIFLLPVYVGRI